MASKTTLTAKNLEALGAPALAELLIEISTGNANAKRRLRMELAGGESPAKLANEIRKRMTAVGAATANVSWRSLKAFRADLDSQRRLTLEQVATAAPAEALDLMWQFIALGDAVIERTHDASGAIFAIFDEACCNAGLIAAAAPQDISALAAHAVEAIMYNAFGQNDNLVHALAPVLGHEGLTRLRELLGTAVADPERRGVIKGRKISRWRRRREAESDVLQRRARSESIRIAQRAIADGLGDVDTYIRLQTDPKLPDHAVAIAERLLRAKRAEEALRTLDAAGDYRKVIMPEAWGVLRLEALEALGRPDDAQAFRLGRFHVNLDAAALRAYLKRLPDFDDVEAEDEALDRVLQFPDATRALAFLVGWPALERASRLVLSRWREIDGNDTSVLAPAAERLSGRYALAATLLLRNMIVDIFDHARASQYEEAALHLAECERLAARIEDWHGHATHEVFLARLTAAHGRKMGLAGR